MMSGFHSRMFSTVVPAASSSAWSNVGSAWNGRTSTSSMLYARRVNSMFRSMNGRSRWSSWGPTLNRWTKADASPQVVRCGGHHRDDHQRGEEPSLDELLERERQEVERRVPSEHRVDDPHGDVPRRSPQLIGLPLRRHARPGPEPGPEHARQPYLSNPQDADVEAGQPAEEQRARDPRQDQPQEQA